MQKLQVNAPVDLEEDEDELTFDDVALAAFQGLLSSGKYEDIAVAASIAWVQAVPAFFQARAEFPEMMERIYGKPKA